MAAAAAPRAGAERGEADGRERGRTGGSRTAGAAVNIQRTNQLTYSPPTTTHTQHSEPPHTATPRGARNRGVDTTATVDRPHRLGSADACGVVPLQRACCCSSPPARGTKRMLAG